MDMEAVKQRALQINVLSRILAQTLMSWARNAKDSINMQIHDMHLPI